MPGTKIENARITRTKFGVEDHGILTATLSLDFGGSGAGWGGYALDSPVKDADGKFLRREGTDWGCEFLHRIMQTVGVSSWEDLPGTHIRVRRESDLWGAKILAIGHIIKDNWFMPEEDLEHLKDKILGREPA